MPYDYIADYTVQQGGLRSRYDVILMAHQGGVSGKMLVHGRDPKFGEQSYQRTKEFPSHGYVDGARDITGGMGFQGLARLEEFLNKGGTLLLMGSAGRLANYLDLHARKFAALSLRGVAPRNYRKIPKSSHIKDLQDKEAA